MEQKTSTPNQHKWITKLLGYDFTIVYKRGKENLVADALSRVAKVYSLSVVTGQLLQKIKDSYIGDTRLSTLIQQLQHDPPGRQGYIYTEMGYYSEEIRWW